MGCVLLMLLLYPAYVVCPTCTTSWVIPTHCVRREMVGNILYSMVYSMVYSITIQYTSKFSSIELPKAILGRRGWGLVDW